METRPQSSLLVADDEEDVPAEADPEAEIAAEDENRALIAALLLEAGASASTVEPNGLQTPLHLCGMNGFAKTARVLVEKGGADVDAVNKISETPLMYACSEQHEEAVSSER